MPPRRRTPAQANLFEAPARALPEGFTYCPRFLSEAVEQNLLKDVRGLPFREFEFHGFLGKRRIVSFGWRYDFNGGGLQRTEDIPEFLRTVREKAAAFAGLSTSNLQQVLITEYRPGAAIGWHKDRSVFGEVVGISLLSSCMFRLRRRTEAGWQRASLRLEPRSAYLLAGSARTQWEHSIPAVDDLRYSLTFRNLEECLRRRS
jgi:alkylated DNA repair dioxygenase AlkB